MSQFPQMLYRAPGAEQHHGVSVDTKIVHHAEDHAQALADGWHETTTAAAEAVAQPPATDAHVAVGSTRFSDGEVQTVESLEAAKHDVPPTRAELEQKAAELGLKYHGNTSDKKLAEAIAAHLAKH